MTTTARTCPPSAVADQILPWEDVKAGDLVLWDGEFRPVERTAPYGCREEGVWAVEFADIPGEVCIPVGTYAAVRRYTEGISERGALVIAALDEAADTRDERARGSGCPACAVQDYMQRGTQCDEHREHAERAAEYRAERDRLEAGR